ncbi:hypothetical protein FAM09_05870 [Niastella caeni]|uniref:Uncharacterized protein n=1 Tax=Niastella caeni TaxID=2569763 RepID=A0A4S8I3K4_9BACT|nr:hypothetical protein [Niastella caeni]THU41624.1 hypothetical protein FAM09_05870 [Niastella caeni]
MRFLLVIAAILLFAEYSNLDQLFNLTEVEIVIFCDDPESEEENKSEKDFKKFKKHHYNFDYASLLTFLNEQKKHLRKSGLCLKGHCALIDQPPEA